MAASSDEISHKKRRVTDTKKKTSKRVKEPRPHPSYRLNKRYWDDIRAGRRSNCSVSSGLHPGISPQLSLTPNLIEPMHSSVAAYQKPLPYLPMPGLKPNFPIPTNYIPHPFFMPQPSTSACPNFLNTFPIASSVANNLNFGSPEANTTEPEKSKPNVSGEKEAFETNPSDSDLEIDKMVDGMMLSLASQKKIKQQEPKENMTAKTFSGQTPLVVLPIPVSIPTPVFIPLDRKSVV